MPSIEETMGGNAPSCTSKDVDLENLEEMQLEPVPLSSPTTTTIDVSSQDVEKEEHVCEKLKKKKESKKMHPIKRSCLARFAKEIPFNRFKESPMFENPSELFKLPKIQKTPVTPEPFQESEEMDLGEFDREVKLPMPRRYFYKSRCKNISKYWQSVERYCRAITKSDIKFLHQLIAKQEHTETMCYTIPPLGEHYTLHWATKDLTDEEIASNPNRSRPRGTLAPHSSALNLLQKGNVDVKYSLSLDSETVPSPLHSFLTENFNKMFEEDKEKQSRENVMLNSNEIQPDSEILSDSNDSLSPVNFLPGNSATLYCGTRPLENVNVTLASRLKRDLESIGVTCHGEQIIADDEIVMEMKRCMAQMNTLGANNIIQLKRCLKLAEVEMKKQELRQKLRNCDSEIVLIHQKIHSTKLKEEPVNRRDRDRAWKLLKNRETLIKEIDSFDS